MVQAAPVPFDRDQSLAKALEWIETAAVQGAELVVFPEAFLSGYPKLLDFGAGWDVGPRKGGCCSGDTSRVRSTCPVRRRRRSEKHAATAASTW